MVQIIKHNKVFCSRKELDHFTNNLRSCIDLACELYQVEVGQLPFASKKSLHALILNMATSLLSKQQASLMLSGMHAMLQSCDGKVLIAMDQSYSVEEFSAIAEAIGAMSQLIVSAIASGKRQQIIKCFKANAEGKNVTIKKFIQTDKLT